MRGERRRAARIDFDRQVLVLDGMRPMPGRVVNISIGGMLLRLPRSIMSRSDIRVVVSLPSEKRRLVFAAIRVRLARTGGEVQCGLRFGPLDARTELAVRRFVTMRLTRCSGPELDRLYAEALAQRCVTKVDS